MAVRLGRLRLDLARHPLDEAVGHVDVVVRHLARPQAVDESAFGAVADVVLHHEPDRAVERQVERHGKQRERLAGGTARQRVPREEGVAGRNSVTARLITDPVDDRLGSPLGRIVLTRQERHRRRPQPHRQLDLGRDRGRRAQPGAGSPGGRSHRRRALRQPLRHGRADLHVDRGGCLARPPERPRRPGLVVLVGEQPRPFTLDEFDGHPRHSPARLGRDRRHPGERSDARQIARHLDLRKAAGPQRHERQKRQSHEDQHRHDAADAPLALAEFPHRALSRRRR